MDPPPPNEASTSANPETQNGASSRTQSFSQQSDGSQTVAEFIDSQLQLEADAREALPYKFDNCTQPLGKLRQVLFSCLTCNPPTNEPSASYKPAGVCYSCSIQCHGDHTLVELFNKRDFVCDCGTTRLPSTSPCTLRVNPETNTKGGVHSEAPEPNNKYNQNFKNKFCGCECDYDAESQKGTMFQCLGLGTAEEGGCGEDWWHPGCIVGIGPDWFEAPGRSAATAKKQNTDGALATISEVAEAVTEASSTEGAQNATTAEAGATSGAAPEDDSEDDDPPLPPGFPEEDDFEGFICYKCVEAHPWIKKYAGAPGFLAPVFKRSTAPSPERGLLAKTEAAIASNTPNPKKRKSDDDNDSVTSSASKRVKEMTPDAASTANEAILTANEATSVDEPTSPLKDSPECKIQSLPTPPGLISLFFKSNFRDHLCRCPSCFPQLKKHTQLLEEEEIYEPEMSEDEAEGGGSTVGSGSIYERGESVLKNVDRVRAIEGVMAYNHLKDKLTPFFQQFAESGKAISAEDIKAHFAKMRGDAEGIREAGKGAKDEAQRREQSGY